MKHTVNPLIFPGFINCHVRDAAALCSYFAWLEKEIPTGTVTEISGADKLASLRGEMENFVGLSFDTISSVGANGAIIHYKPSAGKYNRFLHKSRCDNFLANLGNFLGYLLSYFQII